MGPPPYALPAQTRRLGSHEELGDAVQTLTDKLIDAAERLDQTIQGKVGLVPDRTTATDRLDDFDLPLRPRHLLSDAPGPGVLEELSLASAVNTWAVDVYVDGRRLFDGGDGVLSWTFYEAVSKRMDEIEAVQESAAPTDYVLRILDLEFQETLKVYAYSTSGTSRVKRYLAKWKTRATLTRR